MIGRLNLRSDGRRLLTYGVSRDADLILEMSASTATSRTLTRSLVRS